MYLYYGSLLLVLASIGDAFFGGWLIECSGLIKLNFYKVRCDHWTASYRILRSEEYLLGACSISGNSGGTIRFLVSRATQDTDGPMCESVIHSMVSAVLLQQRG